MVTVAGENFVAEAKNDNSVVTFRYIYNLLVKEIQSTLLQPIPLDTYLKIATSLAGLKGQRYEGMEAKIRDNLIELICGSAKLLFEIRNQKLLVEQRSESLSQKSEAVTGSVIDYSKLADEEKYILDGEKESQKRRKLVLNAIIRGRPKVLESIISKIRSKQIVVRFIRPMEQFVGIDMARYGPFQEEDIATLPLENARSLIQTGDAIEIQIAY